MICRSDGGENMKIINREMKAEVTITDKSNHSLDCQASFNSDGYITLRNFTRPNNDSDEIIILSAEETQAVIQLFSRLGCLFRNNTLPF